MRGIHAFFLILGEPEAYGLPPKPQIPTIYLKSAWTSAFATAIASIIATLVSVRIFLMTSNSPSEKRLEELREQAWKEGVVPGKGVDVAGGPIPRKPGYYGQPVVKPPVWTWEVPLYFFFGGIAGMSAVIASGAIIFHHVDLARAAMWVAAIAGAILSPILLIMDLGRPHLFLNMLRVFKHRSAMSMGAWILSLFGACAVPGLIALELHAHQIFPGTLGSTSSRLPLASSFLVRRSSELCSRLTPAC